MCHLPRADGAACRPTKSKTCSANDSGLLGISAATGDMRELLAREETDAVARLAVGDLLSIRSAKAIGALTAALRRARHARLLGRHRRARAAVVRARICDGLASSACTLDASANERQRIRHLDRQRAASWSASSRPTKS